MFNTSNSGYSLSDIAAITRGNSGYGDGFGGGGAWWIIILFLFVFCGWGDGGMFGNRGNGNGSNGGSGGGGTNWVLPTLNTAYQGALTRGDLCSEFSFNDLQNGVRGIAQDVSNGFSNLNSTICHQQYDTAGLINGLQGTVAAGFAGVDNAICTLGYQNAALINGVENTINQNANAANIMALQNQNALQAQLAQCCCDTKSMFADTKYTMATDTCALQNTMNTNTRDILDNQNANTRAILDYLCQEKISDLQSENSALRLAASQQAQNNYLISQLRPQPVPAYPASSPCGLGNWSPAVLAGGYAYNCGCGQCA